MKCNCVKSQKVVEIDHFDDLVVFFFYFVVGFLYSSSIQSF